ncbi:MAG: tetratricopeptide repeat protein [Nitrospira sp.]|nr:tetratricopeptide repeat protein [Nitrospira sp.]
MTTHFPEDPTNHLPTIRQRVPFGLRLTAACALLLLTAFPVFSQPPVPPPDYPQSLEQDLKKLLDAQAQDSSDPRQLIQLAGLYLELGEELYSEKAQKLAAFDAGAKLAKRAMELDENNAEAHYLYAANLGSAADTKGVAASLLALDDIKAHARRTLELQKDHVAALHMAGMMLEELPQFMGGNKAVALDYLKRAAAIDPNASHVRLDLAKMYLKRRDPESAKRELLAIVSMDNPSDAYPWARRYRPEAERLLVSLKPDEPSGAGTR